MKKLLLIVDPQLDFINGSLPVPNAPQAMDALAHYVREHDGEYVSKVITMDWHPYTHCSFAYLGGPWPIHCVQHSVGAGIWQPLFDAVYETSGRVTLLTKGTSAHREEYSIFKNRKSLLQLKKLLHDEGIEQIDICGLAGDVCVLNTLKDGIRIYGNGFFNVLRDYSPFLDGGVALNAFLDRK